MSRWNEHVRLGDVFHNSEMSFEDRRDEIVIRIKRTAWYKRADEFDDDLCAFVEELAWVDDEDQFDDVWDAIYDVADADRVWIDTVGVVGA